MAVPLKDLVVPGHRPFGIELEMFDATSWGEHYCDCGSPCCKGSWDGWSDPDEGYKVEEALRAMSRAALTAATDRRGPAGLREGPGLRHVAPRLGPALRAGRDRRPPLRGTDAQASQVSP